MRNRTLRSALKAFGIVTCVALFAGILSTALVVYGPAEAQSVRPPAGAVTNATPEGGASGAGPTGGMVPGEVLGATSDADIWRQIRQGESFNTQAGGPNAGALVQSEGWAWQAFRTGPLSSASRTG